MRKIFKAPGGVLENRSWPVILVLSFWIFPACLVADTIHLKSNRKVIGIIDQTSSNEHHVTIKTSIGTQKIPRDKIKEMKVEENTSYTEANGDMAAAEGQLDRALTLYNKALLNDPGNTRLEDKIARLKSKIENRDLENYGNRIQTIRDKITVENYQEAIDDAALLEKRVKEPSAKLTCQKLIAESHIGLARQFSDKVAYLDAEKHYRMARQAWPEGPLAPLELAEMLQLNPSGKRTAVGLYEDGIRLAQKHPDQLRADKVLEYQFELGKLLFAQNEFYRAADVFLDVTHADSAYRFPDAVGLAVDSYFKVQTSGSDSSADVDKIIADLNSIIKLKPNEDRAYLLLGRIYFNKQDWVQSRDNLNAAVRNSHGSGGSQLALQDAMYYLGIAHRNLDETREAAEILERLISQFAGTYEAICELAEIRLEQALYNESKDLFQQALDMDQDKYRAYFGMGKTMQKLRSYKEARNNYREVVLRDPSNAHAQFSIARSFFDEDDWNNASSNAQKAIDLVKENFDNESMGIEQSRIMAEAYTLMGDSNRNLNKTNSARQSYKTALVFVDDYPAAFDGMGMTFQADGMYKDAETWFIRAINSAPKNPNYYLSLAINLHQYRKKDDRALNYYMEYIRLGGRDPKVREWIRECGGASPEI
jgi:tetratricopeptide (TPR) repeat protein